MSRTTLLLALLALLWVTGPAAAKKTVKGTKWSPKTGIKPGTKMYLIETKDNPKKEKWTGKNAKVPGHGGSVLTKPESETMVEPEGMWKDDDKWWAPTPGPEGHGHGGTWNHDHDKWTGAEPEPEGKWTDDAKWTEPEPGPEDLKWTETTPVWTPGPGGMTWRDEPDPEQTNTWIKVHI